MTARGRSWVLPVSILLALLLGLLPMPELLQPLRPYWLALVLAYWVIEDSERVGLGFAFAVGLVADQATAQRVAQASGAQVLLWGWVTGDARATLAPTLLFVDLTPGLALDLCDTPPWYDTEISGEGRLELGQLAGERAAALVGKF